MQLEAKRKLSRHVECTCELTRVLDRLAGLDSNDVFSHYIYVDESYIKDKVLPIRVPGGTVGNVKFDGDRNITSIYIDTDYVIKTYPKDIDEKLKEFIGKSLIE